MSAEPAEPFLSVVMPSYNEARHIERCLRAVLAQPVVRDVIVVDDCSTDETRAAVESIMQNDTRVRLVKHVLNRGKGAALRSGFAECSGRVVIVQDADLEYDPADYPRVLEPILRGHAEAVLGSRFLGGGTHRVLYFWHYVGNKLLTLLSNCFTGLNLSDMETGMKAMTQDTLRKLHLCEDRFGIEPELVAKLARLDIPIYEVPISYYGRTYAEGKKIGWRDGARALWCIVKYCWR
jgi:glycosyltransferase involved in cell wall biosynthesis